MVNNHSSKIGGNEAEPETSMKYRGYYSLTLVTPDGEVAKTEQTAEFEVDEFEHPGGRLRRIALNEMLRQSAMGVCINEFSEVSV